MSEHGTVERYVEGCRCSRCVLAMARGDEQRREAAVRDGRERSLLARRQRREGLAPLPVPSSFARCQRGCGRLVWDFDAGLCGACCESEAA